MEIKSILNNFNPLKNGENNSRKPVKSAEEKLDKLEISEKASEMNKTSSEIKNITEIKERIRTKFYDSDEVIKTVSGEIYKEILKK